WVAEQKIFECSCHYSHYDPREGAAVIDGPAPRALAALPLKVADGKLVVAKPFTARVGIVPPDAAHGAHDLTGEILTSKLNEPDQKFRPTIERGRKPHDRYQDILAKRRCGSAARGRHIHGLGADAADHRAALSDADPGADAGGAAELHPSHGRAAEETGRRKLVPFPPNL